MTNAEYDAEEKRIFEAVSDPGATVGATLPDGNLQVTPDMGLAPVYADDLGRLWRRAQGKLVCILDLREIQDSTGTVADASRFPE